MFRALVGESFDALPPAVRALHDSAPKSTFTGHCDIDRGQSPLSRAIGIAARLPRAGRDVPLGVSIVREPSHETWTREFAGHAMRSKLRARGMLLEERVGAAAFRFALHADGAGIRWDLVGVRVLGLPLPRAWFRGMRASEGVNGGRYAFDVRAELPVIGLLVHYRGQLDAA